jgi:hypothetical protein
MKSKFSKNSSNGERDFGFENMPQKKHGKGNPNSQNEEQRKESQYQENQSKQLAKKHDGKSKKVTKE